jgi:hypothetical protein
MKKTTTALLSLFIGSAITSNVFALDIHKSYGKCRVTYTQGQVDSNWFKKTRYVINFNDNRDICNRGVKAFIKQTNHWLKDSYENADGNLQRTITDIQPIECKKQHTSGFMWLGHTFGAYEKCGDKYDNQFNDGLITKL